MLNKVTIEIVVRLVTYSIVLCAQVHGAFAGYSNVTIGLLNTHYAILPIPKVIQYPRTVDPDSNMWHRCVTATGQPDFVQGLDHSEDVNSGVDITEPLQGKPPKSVEKEC